MENKKETTLKKFKVPVLWQVGGYVVVEAENPELALDKAIDIERFGKGFPLPTEFEYINDSFEIENDLDLVELVDSISE